MSTAIEHTLFTVESIPGDERELRRAACTCGHVTSWAATDTELLNNWTFHRVFVEHEWFRALTRVWNTATVSRR